MRERVQCFIAPHTLTRTCMHTSLSGTVNLDRAIEVDGTGQPTKLTTLDLYANNVGHGLRSDAASLLPSN